MTILAIAQTCANRLQLTSPTTFIGSTSNNMILLKAMIDMALSEIADDFPWPELIKEHTFTLATSTAAYALPGDFDRVQNETLWNRTQLWPLIGPLDSVEWQRYVSGLVTTIPRQRFQIKGWASTQFYVHPTPTSSENGQTCVYNYCSTVTRIPKTWVTLTSWNGIQYCSYNGNIYDRGATGAATTGATPPTHTTGAVSDGVVTWTYTSTYDAFTHDTDEIILPEDSIIDGAVWRFKRERGLDYEDLRKSAEDELQITKTKKCGADVLTINRWRMSTPMIGPWSYPDSNYGI